MVAEEIGTTLTQHIIETQKKFPAASGTFTRVFTELAVAGKIISSYVNKAGITDITGKRGSENVHGEEQAKLDVIANNILINRLLRTGMVAAISSEENDEILLAPDEISRNAKYVLSFDPLDGSSNIDVNVSIGTIFSMHARKTPVGERISEADFLQKGSLQVAAGYILYGSSTIFVYCSGHGVFGFTLDPTIGEYILSHPHIKTDKDGNTYSVNEGNQKYWDKGDKELLSYFTGTHPENDKPYSGRYIGSLVSDFHRNLMKGGIYFYPRCTKNGKRDNGKLRLLYEAAPLAYIAKYAGGCAFDGKTDILEIEPKEIHHRVPLYIGSKREINLARRFVSEQ